MAEDEALAELRTLRGVGEFIASGILLRGAGVDGLLAGMRTRQRATTRSCKRLRRALCSSARTLEPRRGGTWGTRLGDACFEILASIEQAHLHARDAVHGAQPLDEGSRVHVARQSQLERGGARAAGAEGVLGLHLNHV